MQNNRLTFMERLSERLTSVEAILKKLDPIYNPQNHPNNFSKRNGSVFFGLSKRNGSV